MSSLSAALVALLTLSVLATAAPASAQALEREASGASADDRRLEGTQQHRQGTAVLAMGLTVNLVGAGASFYTIVASSWGAGGCDHACPASQDRAPGIAASLGTAGLGLVLFFVGLGLDIHGRILRGHAADAPSLSLGGDGLTISF